MLKVVRWRRQAQDAAQVEGVAAAQDARWRVQEKRLVIDAPSGRRSPSRAGAGAARKGVLRRRRRELPVNASSKVDSEQTKRVPRARAGPGRADFGADTARWCG